MCLFKTPKAPPPPVLPPEPARARRPDGEAIATGARRRVSDQMRSRAATILTSGQGAVEDADLTKKTLLGA
jgi:hypothetical protein